MNWVRNTLLVAVAVGVLWVLLAGLGGWTLGAPPIASGESPCYRTMRADFFIPMWKPAPAYVCGQ